MAALPNVLSSIRLLFVPLLLVLAWGGFANTFFTCLIVTLLTDTLDGFLARKFNATSDLGAKLDSTADFATYLALPFCAWWLRPEVIRAEAIWLGLALFFYIAAAAAGFVKYRKIPSYHTWLSKFLSVVAAVVGLVFFGGGPGWPLRVLAPLVVVSSLEEIAITVLLPAWRANVPSLWHALRLRKGAPNSSPAR